MRHFQIWLASAFLLAFVPSPTIGDEPSVDVTVAMQLRELVPLASSMTYREWDKVRGMDYDMAPVSISDFPNQSLSALLCSSQILQGKATNDFRLLWKEADPELVDDTLCKSSAKGYVTLLQPEFISDVNCRVDGDVAKGVAKFKAPNFFEGQVEFIARRTDGKWSIDQFSLPGRNLLSKRDRVNGWSVYRIE